MESLHERNAVHMYHALLHILIILMKKFYTYVRKYKTVNLICCGIPGFPCLLFNQPSNVAIFTVFFLSINVYMILTKSHLKFFFFSLLGKAKTLP